MIAMGLIVLGAVLMAGRLLPGGGVDLTGGMVMLTFASCFLFFAFWKRVYGLLIPGCMFAGLSVGVTFADMVGGASVLLGLALGFFAMFFLGHVLFQKRHPWPIYPAMVLCVPGIVTAVANLPGMLAGGIFIVPLLLIGLGLYLGRGR